MILPIVLFGDPILKKRVEDVSPEQKDLKEFIENMYETMYAADGVGLAAPQVGKSINLFIMDASTFADEYPDAKDFKKVFINPEMIEESGEEWLFNEGCLSFPHLREEVLRKPKIIINYLDENFVEHEETYEGIIARIIQHEYDHLRGIVFVDRLTFLKKQLIKNKLINISKGNVNAPYKVKTTRIKK
ncbi:MAG: peptide deformylase [Bacteroidales bacterium]|nr:peptide deformylase [Bacteroidales bacterium]